MSRLHRGAMLTMFGLRDLADQWRQIASPDLAYYQDEEAGVAQILDHSGNNHHGTPSGLTLGEDPLVPRTRRTAAYYDGASSHIRLPAGVIDAAHQGTGWTAWGIYSHPSPGSARRDTLIGTADYESHRGVWIYRQRNLDGQVNRLNVRIHDTSGVVHRVFYVEGFFPTTVDTPFMWLVGLKGDQVVFECNGVGFANQGDAPAGWGVAGTASNPPGIGAVHRFAWQHYAWGTRQLTFTANRLLTPAERTQLFSATGL